MREIKLLQVFLKQVNENTKVMMGMIEQIANFNLTDKKCFENEYKLNLPLTTLADLETLNQMLLSDDVCNKHFVRNYYLYTFLLSLHNNIQY